jgi:hypothetical protein
VSFDDNVETPPIIVNMNSDENGYSVSITFYVGNNTAPTTLNLLLKRTR